MPSLVFISDYVNRVAVSPVRKVMTPAYDAAENLIKMDTDRFAPKRPYALKIKGSPMPKTTSSRLKKSLQIKRSRKKTKHAKKSENSDLPDFSKTALHLIDQAAALIKEGIRIGSREGVKERRVIKRAASNFVDSATRRLNQVIKHGADTIHKGINKV
jgi:hypothetical protein